MTRRLFVFGGYDKNNIVDDTLIYYLTALSELGDIVFNMDNSLSDSDLDKVKQISNVLYTKAERHGEYDFGSYKRGFFWAKENNILKDYDWVYLVNDSTYGPLKPLKPILEDLESQNKNAVGMFLCTNDYYGKYLQSWFMGFKPVIFNSDWFNEFLKNVKKYERKKDVVINCEFGFSSELWKNKVDCAAFMEDREENDSFRNPLKTLRNGFPFIKKSQLSLNNIGSENKIKKYLPKDLKSIMNNHMLANNLYINKYESIFSITLFSVPILEIYKNNQTVKYLIKKYKVKMFKYIPILVIKIKNK